MEAIVAFAISLGALTLFIGFKVLEQARALPRYRSARTRADAAVGKAYTQLRQRGVQLRQRISLRGAARVAAHHAVSSIARIARGVEMYAIELTRRLARNSGHGGKETTSSFLKQVSTHKRALDTERVKRDTQL